MTMRYSHLATDHLHRAMGGFSETVVGTKPGTSTTVSSNVPGQLTSQPFDDVRHTPGGPGATRTPDLRFRNSQAADEPPES
jgi:hypothetical protein